jgi:2-oxoglutarate ferredoxin oxidoreductase subunit beta
MSTDLHRPADVPPVGLHRPADVPPVGLGLPTLRGGLDGVPLLAAEAAPQTRKDFTSDSEVRWCPGCGDYAILAAVQGFMPELGIRRENVVCISGIGCSSRFPYYLDTYGLHSIHGRAPAIATGLATSRPDLAVWVITGDGDALSIGGNHLIHALRRNVNLTILLFNNRIYGLTKGQYSPTSEPGKVTKSTPVGSVDTPFNPISLALGAEASFVARTLDTDRKHLTEVLRQAVRHRGSSLVEIYQNCPIFNDGAFEVLKDRDEASARLIRLEHGAPIRFGVDGERGLVRGSAGTVEIAQVSEVGEAALLVHDASAEDPSVQFALSRLDDPTLSHVPIGVFRAVHRPTYDDQVRAQVDDAVAAGGGPASDAELAALIAGLDTWTVA